MTTDPSTYKFNHTLLRVKDPKRSVKYYEFLGLKQLHVINNPEQKWDMYFLGYDSQGALSSGNHVSDREGVVRLRHDHGTETDDNFKIANGNSDPRGFGHLCISVDNIQAACKRIEDAGYKFQKKLTDGRMRNIAFALDPDGYWVEVIGRKPVEETENETSTDLDTYRMNHTMIRVKDAEKSLSFYKDVLGMTLKRTHEAESAGFNLYFLGYGEPVKDGKSAELEGLLELTWNYGTEKEEDFKYHSGNEDPKGFGHISVSVDNINAAAARFDEKGVKWQKKVEKDASQEHGTLLDPDGYWIEIVQNQKLKQSSL